MSAHPPGIGSRRTRAAFAVLVAVALVAAAAWVVRSYRDARSSSTRDAAATALRSPSAMSNAADRSGTGGDATATSSIGSPIPATKNEHRGKHAVRTRQGMWWGVDSSGPITAQAIDNVRGWYRGGEKPQFWGRYVSGHYAVSAEELSYARRQGIFVYLLVNDANCSQCANGNDICGHDRTPGQARTDALAATRAAAAVGVPAHTVLFKDIEQIGSCRGEPTATYLETWYGTLKSTHYRTGFYGNAHEQTFDFPRAYCAVVAKDKVFREEVALDMNEEEPQLGAPKGTVGPANAPRFNPLKPNCAPKSAVKIWQYGESTSAENYTDIDQARPDIDGLLAPDGGVTGG